MTELVKFTSDDGAGILVEVAEARGPVARGGRAGAGIEEDGERRPHRRGLLDQAETSVRAVGRRLFAALFSDPAVAGIYRASAAVAAERGESLRIVLRIDAPELAMLPWESVFDDATNSYVSRREPLVR